MSSKIITIGLNNIDGLGMLVETRVNCDMGDHGRLDTPVHTYFNDIKYGLTYVSKTGNLIYREGVEHEQNEN